jgi:uncharacterized protein YndB with AHSA1/START domain
MWLYAMVSPEGERHWCRVDISAVEAERSFSSVAVFSDENGVPNDVIPPMHWHVRFRPEGSGTTVVVEISFEHDADVAKILDMGFETGFTMALGNLDGLLAGR